MKKHRRISAIEEDIRWYAARLHDSQEHRQICHYEQRLDELRAELKAAKADPEFAKLYQAHEVLKENGLDHEIYGFRP